MTRRDPDAPPLPAVDLFRAFRDFPAPLALTDREGHVDLANTRFTERFAAHDMSESWLRQAAAEAGDTWQRVMLSPGSSRPAGLPALVLAKDNHVLLTLDESPGMAALEQLASLQQRITDLERLAATDHLTGAWNRAHLDRVLAIEIARSLAQRLPLTLLLLDIDHFKQVNDTFGHAAGDAVLREMVTVVQSRIRCSDVLFRWGGEEFVVLVSSAGHRRAQVVAEGLRTKLAAHDFPVVGRVTASFGVAEYDGEQPATDWFRRLDEALYRAKTGGRNRVVVADGGNSDRWGAEAGPSALHLVWLEAYECGDPTIDEEHQELFRLANRLIDASLDPGTSLQQLVAVLDLLLEHVGHHFQDEEAILERLQYEGLAAHRRAHAGLLHRARELRQRVCGGALSVGAVVEFLAQDVVARHMLAVDRAFFPLFDPSLGN